MQNGTEIMPLQSDTSTFIWRPDDEIGSRIYLIRATTKDGLTTTKRVVYLQ